MAQSAPDANSLPPASREAPQAGRNTAAGAALGEMPTAPSAPPAAASFPFYLDKYEVRGEVAAGGMGVVYEAFDPVLGRRVALKMIRPGALDRADAVERFYREARAVAGLDHPHVIKLFDVRQRDGRHYFAMPFAAGGSLAQNLGRYAGNARAAVALVEKVARGVQAAHERGILHRDLKPANVLLDEHGEPLVSDFGLAKTDGAPGADSALVLGGGTLTYPGQTPGTPAYMAPEQIAPHLGPVTVRSDVWALGVLLYELLAGRRPFQGGTRDELTRQIRTEEPPRLTVRGGDATLEGVVRKCLRKDPARRYASAGALAADLRRWLDGEHRKPLPVRAWRAARRHPGAVLTAAVAAAALAAAAVYVLDPGRELDRLQGKLDRGESVTLLEDVGRPRWARTLVGGDNLTTVSPPAGPFAVHSRTQSGLVQIAPGPRGPGYRFFADVRFEGTAPRVVSKAGLFFLHSQHPTEEGEHHCFATFTVRDETLRESKNTTWHAALLAALPNGPFQTYPFAAVGPDDLEPLAHEVARTGHTYLKADLELRTFCQPAPNHVVGLGGSKWLRLPPGGAGEWHQLAVVVTGDRVRTFFDGRPLHDVRRAKEMALMRRVLLSHAARLPGNAAEFPASGALGLFADRAVVSFRRSGIEPPGGDN